MPPSNQDDESEVSGSGGGAMNSSGGANAAPNPPSSSFGPAPVGRLVDAAAHYRDFSTDAPNPMEKEGAQNFPMKLHIILSNPEFQDIIAWLPHGRSWRILQHKAFEERVIPLYFRHGRYSSFARQVNGWSFKRITCGPDYNSYYHEMFLRGKPHLCRKMKRITSREAKEAESDPDAPVPDFYSISREYPLPELTGFRARDGSGLSDEAGLTGGRGDLDGHLRTGNREQDIAALERRRQEILQRFTSLQPGMNPAQGLTDPNAALMMLLAMQQQQQQQQQQLPAQLGATPNLAATLAALSGGMNSGALAAANPFGYGNFGLHGFAQAQATPIAQLLSQYQQAGAVGSPFPAPAPSSGLPGLPFNLAETLGQNPALAQGLANQQGAASGLSSQLSALLGSSMGSFAGAAGGAASSNGASNQFLMQQLLSGSNGLSGNDFSSLLQPPSVAAAAESSDNDRKAANDPPAPPMASIQNPSSALEALQRQLSGRVAAQEHLPAPAPASAPASAASIDPADLQKMLALLQKQTQSPSQVAAPASPAAAPAVPQSTTAAIGTSVPNNFLSLFGLPQQQAPGAQTQVAESPAPQQDDGQMQRQLLSALAAAGAGRGTNGAMPNGMNLDLQQLLQAQLAGMPELNNAGPAAPSKE